MTNQNENVIIGAGQSSLWFVSDLLLGQRPDEEYRTLVEEWTNVVRKNDAVVLLGNVAADGKVFWFNQLKSLPGQKILFCGDLETNRNKWYYKFGFTGVVPFNEASLLESVYGPLLVSHLPAFESVSNGGKYAGLSRKFSKQFDRSSCVLNIHGHTRGVGNETHKTFDVSYREGPGQKLLRCDQILNLKFHKT